MKPMIWAHADCLSRFAAPFRRFPDAASVFIIDPDQIDADDWAMKRIAFLYESAVDLGCEVRRGDTTSELLWAARASGCDTIVTLNSPDPAFRRVCDELRKSVKVEVLPAESADTPGVIDLRQFAGYWKKSDPYLFPRA
jgi:hypothetical protein